MKNHLFRRTMALVLTLAIIFSCMTVLSYAADGAVTASTESGNTATIPNAGSNVIAPPEDGVTILFKRTFDDGLSYSEGLSNVIPRENEFKLVDDGTGNKYLQMTARIAEGDTSVDDGYFDLGFSKKPSSLDTLVVQLDVIFDASSGKYPGNFIRFGNTSTYVQRPLAITSSGYNFFEGKYVNKDYYSQTKHTFTYVIKTEETDTGYLMTTNVYVDGSASSVVTVTKSSIHPSVNTMRIGFFSNVPEGSVVGIDNILAYSCDPNKISDPLDVDLGRSFGYGLEIVPFEEELFMKVGADSALLKTKKLTDVNAPVSIDGKAYVPTDVLSRYLGYTVTPSGDNVTFTKSGASTVALTVGSYDATVGSSAVTLSESVIRVNDKYTALYYGDIEKLFGGYFGSYNDMGVIVVSPVEHYAQLASDLALVDVMKRFIFESIDENKGQVNVVDFATFTTKTSQHPYILANQDDFDYYKSIYDGTAAEPDPVLKSYITTIVKSAAGAYSDYAVEVDGEYVSPIVVPVMPYDNNINNGYDGNGGRQNDTDTYATRMKTLAFGYQITREDKYARLAYDYAIALGEYDHWGPAHFLNCADTAGPYAIAYDWLYNRWVELGLDVDKVTEIIFTHGVLPGWYSVNKIPLPWGRRVNYKSSELLNAGSFATMTNNWNAVCTAGMTAASLAIAGDLSNIDTTIEVKNASLVKNTGSNASRYPYVFAYEYVPFNSLGDHTGYATYADYAYNLYSKIQYTLPLNGLDLYAPDGSYEESPSYWAYSANNLFAIGTYNDSVFGDEFGLITNCWGLDKTCYYALNAQSSEYSMWNYSDSGSSLVPGSISTISFPYVAYQRGDYKLAAIRKDMIESGEYAASYLDVFYYTKDVGELELPELQYHMAGIDGYVARDSWEPGSTYAAIMGGYNESAHGQIDAGQFIYHNNGKIWFCDIGAEGYNVYNFGGAVEGNRYYKKSAEGNNTLAISSNPMSEAVGSDKTNSCFAGQYIYGTGHMYKTGDNEYGAYALIDQTEVYYKSAVSAKRGMLFTNDRKTVVIQDEVTFQQPETVHWIGHTYQQVYVSTDGRTAFMTDGVSTIRASLISSNADLRFDILSTYEFLLEDTHRPEYALENGTGYAEGDRSQFKRLVITCENVTSLDLAVVIEDVTGDSSMDVGYTFTPMDNWVPTKDGRQESIVDVTVDFDHNYYGQELDGKLDVFNTYFVDSNMLTVHGNSSTATGDMLALNIPRASFTSATLSGDFLVIDADLFTDKNANNLNLALIGGGSIIGSEALSKLVTTGGDWAHVTVIATSNSIHFYKNGKLVSSKSLGSVSFEDIKLAIVTTTETVGTVSIDNVRARRIIGGATNLDSMIGASKITGWSGYVGAVREKSPVFYYDTVTVNPNAPAYSTGGGEKPADGAGDSPFVELEFEGTFTRVYGYTFSSLSSLEYEGKLIRFFYSNEHAPISIDKACAVRHDGNVFKAQSDNLSSFSSGDLTEFKAESVTVYWHIGDTVETSEYIGIAYAEYTGSNSQVGQITEKIVDGKHVFNATAWSLTEGGALATDEEMLVTSENCHFYLVDKKVDYPYFVETSSGNLIAKKDTSNFLTDLVAGHNRVILNGDIDVSGTTTTLTKRTEIYLNGYTLTYHSEAGAHMFRINYGNLAIYGGGGAIKKTGGGNFFFTQRYQAYEGIDTIIYVEDTTLEMSGVFMDHRIGHVGFKNVTFNQNDTDNTTLVVQNRQNTNKTEATMPKVTLDGCTVNSYGATTSTYALSVSKNSSLIVKGGTHINIPTGIAIRLHNSYTTGGVDADFVNYDNMSVSIEDTYFNAADLYVISLVIPSETNPGSYSPTYTVKSSKIFSGAFRDTLDEDVQDEVLKMANKLKLGNATRSNINNIPTDNIADGCIFARQNDTSAPYIATTDYVAVTWVAGEKSVVEYWLRGSIPTADNAEVQANIALLNQTVESGKKYSYSAGKADTNVTFTAAKFNNFGISLSLTLESSMKVNIFVEQRAGVEFHGFYIDGDEMTYTMITLPDGKTYYRIVIPGVLPTTAAVKHELSVYVTDDNGDITPVRVYFSVLDYAEKILANEKVYGREARDLMANILRYIDTAYQYAGLTTTDDYKAVKTLVSKYINKVTYSLVEKTEAPDLSSVTDALTSVQLRLSDAPKYRFNLAKGYTGTVTLYYTVYGEARVKMFNVVDGTYRGNSYIELGLNAYDLRSDITIKTAGGTGVYKLAYYYNAQAGGNATLTALLNALYAYSEKAEEYKNYYRQSN